MGYRIEITPTALQALKDVTDRRTRDAIVRRIDALVEGPELQGRALREDLAGLFSVRAGGQRYRVIYGLDREDQRVLIYLVGIRREGSRQDVYALAQRLVRRGLV
ncbi:MAG TPA: type II toxin-antitoxin system RelE/ParE family toxin [Dehalococcoidia bacterium]|nr:type II toxin-antitoxin system RelE/ParE family toxin [Dehalococcoidia bacterium]